MQMRVRAAGCQDFNIEMDPEGASYTYFFPNGVSPYALGSDVAAAVGKCTTLSSNCSVTFAVKGLPYEARTDE